MAKINQEEYEVLKGLDDKWKWIARNYNGALITYTSKPMENSNLYWDSFGERMDDRLFQFIQWEDEEPYNIAELIEEYENSAEHVSHVVNERVKALGESWKESEEEEMKKGIEWLKDILFDENVIRLFPNDIEKLHELINQLDEPEVLSQEFINEKAVEVYADTADAEVHVVFRMRDLQNLLVPKQELPVIPKFVAEWISVHHERFDLYPALKRLESNALSWENVYEWYRENTRNFVNAYLTGEYEIEQEPKYYAKIKGHENIGSNDKYWNYNIDMEELSIGDSEVHPNVISEYMFKATKEEWTNLGLTDDNADFELVEELEE